MKKVLMMAMLSLIASPASAWDGYDASTGEAVEIGKGNLVRTGQDIEVYDYGSGEYRNVTVESITDTGSTVEVEVYDYDSGEYRILEMDD